MLATVDVDSCVCVLRGAAVFVGLAPDLPLHSTVTAVAVAGLEGNVRVRLRDRPDWLESRAILLAGSVVHEMSFDGPIGAVFADPGSAVGELLLQEVHAEPVRCVLPWGEELLQACRNVATCGSPGAYPALLGAAFPFRLLNPAADFRGDERLVRVVAHLVSAPEESLNVDVLAAMIGMSPSWLQHEFKKAIGVPIRAFRTWFRIKSAVVALKRGETLLNAALAAGFYDQAHFTNVFREMFGFSPATIFARERRIGWHVENEQAGEELAGRRVS